MPKKHKRLSHDDSLARRFKKNEKFGLVTIRPEVCLLCLRLNGPSFAYLMEQMRRKVEFQIVRP